MAMDYWQKQGNEPLFPELIWSRPENKQQAGKLLIIGGSASGFAGVAEAYASALTAGIGVARVLLPASLQKIVVNVFPEAEFASANASGSFASNALAALIDASAWADGVLLAGDLGKNSETQIMLDRFLSKYTDGLTLAGDSLDLFLASPLTLLDRAHTTLAPSFSQLQKLAAASGIAITSQLALVQLVEKLHELSSKISANTIIAINGQILVATRGQISSTSNANAPSSTKLAATVAVWLLQNPSRIFEASTTAVRT